MDYRYFIGIDVSKDSFVVCLCTDTPQKPRSFGNDARGIAAFAKAYAAQLPRALVVLEATGRYEAALQLALLQQGVALHRASGLHSACFIRSLCPHRKSDESDAAALAIYGKERHRELRLQRLPTPEQQRLEALLARREDVLAMKVAETQRAQHPRYALCRDFVQHMLEAICEQLAELEAQIEQIIAQDDALTTRRSIMQSVPGIGPQTALVLMANMPELGTLTRREVASLAGLAPHPKDSGKHQGYRATRGGRRAVKKALFLAAMAASKSKSTLGEFYQRLIKQGKKPIVALIALARKIITILNAKLRDLLYSQPQRAW